MYCSLHEQEDIFDRLVEKGLKNNDSGIRFRRKLGVDAPDAKCDVQFLSCLGNEKCVNCFAELQDKGIDWAGVTPDTSCDDAVEILAAGGHCKGVAKDSSAKKIFCGTYDSCVVWEDENTNDDEAASDDDIVAINCTALTECDWPGIHKSFIGDGVW